MLNAGENSQKSTENPQKRVTRISAISCYLCHESLIFHLQKFYWMIFYHCKVLYSVMQSHGNSFCGDVVLISFNKASRDDDNILDQVYKSKYVRIFIMMILILYNIIRKMHSNTTVALKLNFMSSLLLKAVFLLICIFLYYSWS